MDSKELITKLEHLKEAFKENELKESMIQEVIDFAFKNSPDVIKCYFCKKIIDPEKESYSRIYSSGELLNMHKECSGHLLQLGILGLM